MHKSIAARYHIQRLRYYGVWYRIYRLVCLVSYCAVYCCYVFSKVLSKLKWTQYKSLAFAKKIAVIWETKKIWNCKISTVKYNIKYLQNTIKEKISIVYLKLDTKIRKYQMEQKTPWSRWKYSDVRQSWFGKGLKNYQ